MYQIGFPISLTGWAAVQLATLIPSPGPLPFAIIVNTTTS